MTDLTAAYPAAPAPLAPAYRRYVLTVLMLIYTLNFLDRQIINTLGESIKNDLHLTDTELGAMSGVAFALLYTFLGIPIARIAERSNRPAIIGASVAAWSAFTMVCGAATNFWQLFLARVGVGVGEAGCSPAAHSLIIDYVPKEKRASALAFFSLGTPLGALLGLIMGAVIADTYGWRVAFLVAGAPGILIAVLTFLTLPEPRAKMRADLAAKTDEGPSFMDALRELATKRSFWFMAFGVAVIAFNGYGSQAFVVPFFLRNHAAELAEMGAAFGLKPLSFLGIVMGVLSGGAAMIGVWIGGAVADRYGQRDARSNMTIPIVGAIIALPFYLVALLTPSGLLALLLMPVPTMLASFWYGPVYGSVQGLVQPRTRATAAAILLFIANLIGLGMGPLFTGILSQTLAESMGPAEGVRYALLIFGFSGLVAAWCFWMARFTIRKDMVS